MARAPGVSRGADAEPSFGRRHRAQFGPARQEGLAARDAGVSRHRTRPGNRRGDARAPGRGREPAARCWPWTPTAPSSSGSGSRGPRSTVCARRRRRSPNWRWNAAGPTSTHIVSGLPFAVLPAATTRLIIDGVHSLLRRGGTFTTFQYAHSFRLAAGGGLSASAQRPARLRADVPVGRPERAAGARALLAPPRPLISEEGPGSSVPPPPGGFAVAGSAHGESETEFGSLAPVRRRRGGSRRRRGRRRCGGARRAPAQRARCRGGPASGPERDPRGA